MQIFNETFNKNEKIHATLNTKYGRYTLQTICAILESNPVNTNGLGKLVQTGIGTRPGRRRMTGTVS